MTLHDILKAKCAEDLFGTDEKTIRKGYIALAKLAHPDSVDASQRKLAEEAFKVIGDYYTFAETLVASGDYGKKLPLKAATTVTIVTKKTTYTISTKVQSGEVADMFNAAYVRDGKPQEAWIKIPLDASDNDLMKAEAETLKGIKEFAEKKPETVKMFSGFFPQLEDSLDIKFKGLRKANIFEKLNDCHTLQDVMDKFPDGLNMKHAAWMWRRLLGALSLMHVAGYIHGAVTPANFLIFPESHRGVLTDFTSAVKIGDKLRVISDKYESYYPPEIFHTNAAGERPYLNVTEKHDVYMAAMCMKNLIAGKTSTIYGYSKKFEGLLNSCLIGGYARLNDAFQVHEDFGKILFDIYGKPKFTEFKMPA